MNRALWMIGQALAIGGLAMLSAGLSSVHAQKHFLTGNNLLSHCRANKNAAILYLQGIADGAALIKDGYMCLPSGATDVQFTDLVCKYLNDNPSLRHESASSIAWIATVEAGWFCPEKPAAKP